VPRIGASRNRKSRDLTADSAAGKDIPAARSCRCCRPGGRWD
jgi:hypothetical protein